MNLFWLVSCLLPQVSCLASQAVTRNEFNRLKAEMQVDISAQFVYIHFTAVFSNSLMHEFILSSFYSRYSHIIRRKGGRSQLDKITCFVWCSVWKESGKLKFLHIYCEYKNKYDSDDNKIYPVLSLLLLSSIDLLSKMTIT